MDIEMTKDAIASEAILCTYRALQQIRKRPLWMDWLPGRMKHERHREKYGELKRLCIRHEDALLSLILSRKLSEAEIHELMFFGGHGVSVVFEHNRHWHRFMAKLRAHEAELPESVSQTLQWLLRVHHW